MFKIRFGTKKEAKEQEILPPDKPEGYDERQKQSACKPELFKFVELGRMDSLDMEKMIKGAGEDITKIEEAHASLSEKMSSSIENARAKHLQLQDAEKAIKKYAKKLDVLYAKVTFELQMWAQIIGYHDKNRERAMNLDSELYGTGDASGTTRDKGFTGQPQKKS